ncbi:hypothetical protein TNCV_2915661 [Trichonephila clavipes]|nr:hypothetical protein TNCV_2915661 [Trichonephila clavipes]
MDFVNPSYISAGWCSSCLTRFKHQRMRLKLIRRNLKHHDFDARNFELHSNDEENTRAVGRFRSAFDCGRVKSSFLTVMRL